MVLIRPILPKVRATTVQTWIHWVVTHTCCKGGSWYVRQAIGGQQGLAPNVAAALSGKHRTEVSLAMIIS